ncbi:hypothetical protein HYW67_01840 [Candidatus Parcubacteria bacterium]|nr:hypothetical protein [Candidatus Parcubacteria bacterium]
MSAPTPKEVRKFFDTFFDLLERKKIFSWDMDTLTAGLASGMWRTFESDTAGHELLATLPRERLRLLLKPIEELKWTKRRYATALRRQGIERIWQLAVRTEPELLHLKGIGRTTLNEIVSNFEEHGLSLGTKLFWVAPPKPPE